MAVLRISRRMFQTRPDGNFVIQTYEAGEIVPGAQAADAVSAGTVDAAHTCSYYFWNKDPTYAIGTALPFGLNARLTNAWFYQGDGNKLMNEFYATQGIFALAGGQYRCADGRLVPQGNQYAGRSQGLEDAHPRPCRQGHREDRRRAATGYRRSTTSTPHSTRARSTPCEWVGPYDDLKLGFQKIAKYYYYPGWWEGGAVVHAFFNLEKWNALPKNYQTILADACAFANTNMLAKYDVKNPQALKEIVQQGVTLRPFSQEIWRLVSRRRPEFMPIFRSRTIISSGSTTIRLPIRRMPIFGCNFRSTLSTLS